MVKLLKYITYLWVFCAPIHFAYAAVSAEEAAKLDSELTPLGAEKAGNADGTIPAWDGGITSPPASYKPGDFHPDPYASDQQKFTIDASNVDDHADKLSTGHQALLKRYPTYKMPVYPTRRSASFRERIYQKTKENAVAGQLAADGEGVLNVAEGFPFPIPKNGQELIWNHKMKDKGVGQVRYNNQVVPTADGKYNLIRIREETYSPYIVEGNTSENINNILIYFFQEVETPARLAGSILLVHETLNQIEQPRQAWVYNTGQRRVRRAPNVAYDNPGTASDAMRTNDMTDMFNGALDRYDWKLIGKKELYVPYNAYKAHSDKVLVKDLVTPNHLNPEFMRYELHRVWVVEANLKEGKRHIYAKRVFYLDEDSYQILALEHYDNRGELTRVSEAHVINYYDRPMLWATLESHHDLPSGRYLAQGLDNQDKVNDFDFEVKLADYTPAALRKRGKR